MKIETAVASTRKRPSDTSQWSAESDAVYNWQAAWVPSDPSTLQAFVEEVMAVDTCGAVCLRATWENRQWLLYVHPAWGVVPRLSCEDGSSVVEQHWPSLEDLGGVWVATHVLPDGHGVPLCYVPSATNFVMGDELVTASPRRVVDVPAGFMALTPTTNEQWGWYCSANGIENSKTGHRHLPVTEVNFFDAKAFSEWAGLDLPTEEQWERAARGDDGRIYPWGNESPGPYPDPRCHWSGGSGEPPDGPSPVFDRPDGASPFGCLDKVGNVWEWTRSLYYRR